MPHFRFEAYGEGFFGKLLHGRGFLPEWVLRWVRPKFRAFAGSPATGPTPRPARPPRRRLAQSSIARELRSTARKSLENATFYHGVALPRQSCAGVAKTPLSFAPPLPLCYIFREARDWARQWFVPFFHGRAGIPGPQKLIQNQSLRGETMTRRLVTVALVGAMAVAFSAGAAAQANPNNSGYVLSATAPPENNVCAQRHARAIFAGAPGTGRPRWRSSSATRISCRSRPPPGRRPAAAPPPPPPPPPAPGPLRRRRCRRSRWRRRRCSTSTRPC